MSLGPLVAAVLAAELWGEGLAADPGPTAVATSSHRSAFKHNLGIDRLTIWRRVVSEDSA